MKEQAKHPVAVKDLAPESRFEGPRRGRRETLGIDVQRAIGHLLQVHHSDLVEEPVPPHLRRLIDLLEQGGHIPRKEQ